MNLDGQFTLSIVIVNYNGKQFLHDCITSIRQHVTIPHEIIVVDNASVDSSVEYMRATFPEVALIASITNLGFAVGNNLGARLATGKYLLLLNNDTVLLDDLSPAIEFLENDLSVGALGIRMVGREHEYRYSAGVFPSPLRLVKFSSLYIKVGGFKQGIFSDGEYVYDVDWVEGSFLLTRMETWRKLGGLNEAYFMYVEDIDFARKIIDEGLRVAYFPKLTYVHFGGYGQSRIGMLINGFRRYHRIHSNLGTRILANTILDVGLLARAALYFLRSFANQSARARAMLCIKALRRYR